MSEESTDAESEAARRYPYWNQPSSDQERHLAGYWGFLAGVSWQGSEQR